MTTFTACSAATDTNPGVRVLLDTPSQVTSPSGELIPFEPFSTPTIPRQPLTGAVLQPGEQVPDRPALAVKIDNAAPARRNHSGLAVADIVYEEIVEGGLTRFAAVFHSRGSDPVGPIRSGRSQDVDLLTPLGRPLLAWSGGNVGVTELIARAPLVDLNWQRGGLGYSRGAGSSPHNLYNDTDTLWGQTPEGHPGPPDQQFEYLAPGEAFAGAIARSVDVGMGGLDVEWTWSDASRRFQRSQGGAPHDDAVHGRIGAANVVVMVVEYRPSAIDARSPEAQTVGNGPAWVFSGGQYLVGRWARSSAAQPIGLFDADGRPVRLEPGSTWIELAEAIPTNDIANPDAAVVIRG